MGEINTVYLEVHKTSSVKEMCHDAYFVSALSVFWNCRIAFKVLSQTLTNKEATTEEKLKNLVYDSFNCYSVTVSLEPKSPDYCY